MKKEIQEIGCKGGIGRGNVAVLSDEDVIRREFSSFYSIKDSSPKYVLSLDEFDMSQNGITHINIEDFLLNKKELFLL